MDYQEDETLELKKSTSELKEEIDIPYFAYGRAYMRVGDEDRQLSQREIKNLILKEEEENNRWEEKASEITLDDIDEETLKTFIKKGKKKEGYHMNILIKKRY